MTDTLDGPEEPKTPPFSLGNTASLEAKRPEIKPARKLEWQEVNAVTWRLVDPDGSQLRIEASHGQWGGYQYPKALAYVLDVGVNDHDWRIRVRLRGNQWRAWGRIIDLATAKRIAQQAVESPTEPKPAKFSIPLNLLGGECRRNGAPMLDPQTYSHVRDVEIGAIRAEVPKTAGAGDDGSINTCASHAFLALVAAEEAVADEDEPNQRPSVG